MYGKGASMNEVEIADALRQLTAVDAEFSERLLRRCLSVIDEEGCRVIDDDDLDMLAAAGSPYASFELIEDQGETPRP